MGGEWRETTLGRICELRAGSVFPPLMQGKRLGEYPFVKVSDMNRATNAHRIQDAANWIDGLELGQLKVKPFPTGTTVFAKIGEALRANRLRYVVRPTVIDNNMMGAVPVTEAADPRFFYYALSQFDFGALASGTALPYLTVGRLSQLKMSLPTLVEQRAIASILGALDDKIDLNRRMSETLEAMARALFKSWFVDFDPVRAKAEGREPGLPKAIADLFPAGLTDSELGEIPEGWAVRVVGDIAAVTTGKRPHARFPKTSPEATVPLWGGNGPMAFVSEPLFDEPLLLTGRVGTLGSVFRISGPCWPSDNTLVLLVRRPTDLEYLFLQLGLIDFASLNRGSTQPLLSQGDLRSQRVLLPAPSVLDHFSRVVGGVFGRGDKLAEESRTLAALRDTLLPKLISGELRIPDAERIVGEVA